MKEKVYSVDNYWDMTILAGMADYNGQPFYYTNVFSKEQNEWTDEYLLTSLSEDVFALGKEMWNYWLHWLATSNKTKIPHQYNYAKEREIKHFKELVTVDSEFEEWKKVEQNYQNGLVFDSYLKENLPTINAKGLFSGKIDGTDTFVEWTEGKINKE